MDWNFSMEEKSPVSKKSCKDGLPQKSIVEHLKLKMMKFKWNYVVFLGLLLGMYAFTATPFGKEAKKTTPPAQEDCDLAARVPQNLEQLSLMTSLYLNMNDNCNFQPIHYQVREGYPSTEIIARVFGEKTADGNFALSKMELKHFEVTNNPQQVIVDTAYITDAVQGKRLIKMKLLNLDEDCGECERKQQMEGSGIDFTINLTTPLVLDATTILDVHIENEKEVYPLFGFNEFDEAMRPRGRHCIIRLAN